MKSKKISSIVLTAIMVKRGKIMGKIFGIALVCLMIGAMFGALLGIVNAEETVAEAWVARYDGPVSGGDMANAIAVDNVGNVYVTGYSTGSGTSQDYATIKYDSAGNELWVARYDGLANNYDYARAIAVDDSGNVYVTGESKGSGTGSDYATIKYDTNGNELWVARYDGPVSGGDMANAIAVDGSGNVYVTGYSYGGSATSGDYGTIKYDTNGNELWVARYNGPASSTDYATDIARAIAVDGAGNVYVTGESKGSGTSQDYATIKYDTNGNELWVARYDSSASRDNAYAIAVDDTGNVYVTGRSVGSGTRYDYATIKYDTNGNELWVARYDGPANNYDYARAIAVDDSGNVYVTGYSESYGGSGIYGNYATIKYDTNGNQLWVARYDGPSDHDEANAIAVDGAGNVYVTGRSRGIGTSDDYATIKYDSAGKQLWVARYHGSGPTNYGDMANAIAVDGSRNVYVTGWSVGIGTMSDYATIKYIPSIPTIESSDISGTQKDTFQPGESVYAYGSGYAASTTYDLYMVNDTTWTDGMAIPLRVSGTATSVTTDGTGNIPAGTLIWASSVIGTYDIVIDVGRDGYYNASTDALDDMDVEDAGFETVPEFTTVAIPVAAIMGLLFLFSQRRKKEK